MDAQTFHIKIIFEIIETFLNSILIAVEFKSFRLIFDVIGYKDEPTDMISFMPVDCVLIEIYVDPSYRSFMNEKEAVIVRSVFLYFPASHKFIIAAVQDMVKISFLCCCLERIIVDVDVEPVPLSCGRFRDRIKLVTRDFTIVMMGTDAVPVAFYCLADKTGSKRRPD